jgi:hypothetical protein
LFANVQLRPAKRLLILVRIRPQFAAFIYPKWQANRYPPRDRLSRLLTPRKSGCLESSSALNEVNDQDDDCNYEQQMDQAAANVADEAKKPKND